MMTRKDAGNRNEKDVAFYLKRGLQDEKHVHVFNNVNLSARGENAQIDHLILHRFGCIVIESKSIFGEVNVNSEKEWSRSYRNQWFGIPSPVEQAKNQIQVLKNCLQDHADELLGTLLGIRKGFALRQYDLLVAISSSAIINREGMPSDIKKATIKAEFIADKVKDIVRSKGIKLLSMQADPAFTKSEMENIFSFLKHHELPIDSSPNDIQDEKPDTPEPSLNEAKKPIVLSCKHCGSKSGLSAHPGRYGYYLKCDQGCSKNTPMKQPCPGCSSGETKVRKKKDRYAIHCASCGEIYPLTYQTKSQA